MHLAYVCADRGVPIGGTKGAAIHVRGVVGALARRGHRVSVLAANVAHPFDDERIETLDFGFDRVLKEVKREIGAGGGAALAREVHSLLLGGRLGEQLGAVDAVRPVDAVYERYSLFSFAALRFARQRGIPFGLEVNAPLVDEQSRYRELELAAAAEALQNLTIRQADVVFVPSRELRGWVEADCGRSRRTLVTPNGVDLKLFARARLQSVPTPEALRDRFVLAFSGSLKAWHGIQHLLAAFATLRSLVPRVHLLVVGDGPLRGEVETAAERLGREHVTLTGAVPHAQVPGWLARADVALAPYPALDGFYFSPLKVVEYQAAGLPVVASRIGHIRRQIEHGETGLLVTPGDESELVRAVVRLYEDPALRRRLGERAREKALATGGWEKVAKRIMKALLTARGRSARRAAAGGER